MGRPERQTKGRRPRGLRMAAIDGGFDAHPAVARHPAKRISDLARNFQASSDLIAKCFESGFAADENEALHGEIGKAGFMLGATKVQFLRQIIDRLG